MLVQLTQSWHPIWHSCPLPGLIPGYRARNKHWALLGVPPHQTKTTPYPQPSKWAVFLAVIFSNYKANKIQLHTKKLILLTLNIGAAAIVALRPLALHMEDLDLIPATPNGSPSTKPGENSEYCGMCLHPPHFTPSYFPKLELPTKYWPIMLTHKKGGDACGGPHRLTLLRLSG